jgi:hypothetical protein
VEIVMSDIHYKWNQIEKMCQDVCEQIKNPPTTIIGLSRGGLVPARIIADYFDIDDFHIIAVKLYNNRKAIGKPVITPFDEKLLSSRRILVVDDIWDSGKTLTAIRKYLAGNFDIRTATLVWKENLLGFKPDYYSKAVSSSKWVVFPWEKLEYQREKKTINQKRHRKRRSGRR